MLFTLSCIQDICWIQHCAVYSYSDGILVLRLLTKQLNSPVFSTTLVLSYQFNFCFLVFLSTIYNGMIWFNLLLLFYRYWKKELWHQVFSTLLNVPSCSEIPNLTSLREKIMTVFFQTRMHEEINTKLEQLLTIVSQRRWDWKSETSLCDAVKFLLPTVSRT